MRTFTTAFLVLLLVLGGVALAVAADGPQENTGLSGLQKLTDQEAREVRGLGMGPQHMFTPGYYGDCPCTTELLTTAPQTRTWSQNQQNVGTPVGNMIQKRPRNCW